MNSKRNEKNKILSKQLRTTICYFPLDLLFSYNKIFFVFGFSIFHFILFFFLKVNECIKQRHIIRINEKVYKKNNTRTLKFVRKNSKSKRRQINTNFYKNIKTLLTSFYLIYLWFFMHVNFKLNYQNLNFKFVFCIKFLLEYKKIYNLYYKIYTRHFFLIYKPSSICLLWIKS